MTNSIGIRDKAASITNQEIEMLDIQEFARATPDKAACVVSETGETISYRDLDRNSNRLANFFDKAGLVEGDVIGVMLDNDLRYCEIAFAARRRGLYYAPISWHLGTSEVGYILNDCGARVIFTAAEMVYKVHQADVDALIIVVGSDDASEDYDTIRDAQPDTRNASGQVAGKDLCYSSGTTGRPKGIKQDLHMPKAVQTAANTWIDCFGFNSDTVYLSPAPLYHAAPLRFVLRVIMGGGTSVIMKKFDGAQALENIERFRVTHSQWVPTMFVRMLALPSKVRNAFDLSSHSVAIHAAAPCPPDIKAKMIDWWGPILWEYYAGSERMGATAISSSEWLSHPGSVGKAKLGVIHILDDDHHELGPNDIGNIYFDGPQFQYLNDPAKTAEAYSPQGWSTLGDIGYLDEDGYLYLTDRKAHTIISGGVNIYPAETENVMITHDMVEDVCVFGIPNEEFGEEVKAAVQLADKSLSGPETEQELIAYCRNRLSHIKVPRSIDFHLTLPRLETGKLNKTLLRQPYLDRDKKS